MNRYFKLYRDSMKRLAKMETILEEVYEPVVESDWKNTWHTASWQARDESHWDQWVDIEYVYADEPSTTPPCIR